MKKTLAQRIEELTDSQIMHMIDVSWDEYGGGELRALGFDVLEDRHGEEYADRAYSELWHKHEKPFARATVQYRPTNPEGFRYDVKLWTADPRGGYSYAGNGKSFADNIAADKYARSHAAAVEYLAPAC